jgi:hypothetical protein
MSSNYIINTPLSVKNGMQVSGNCTFENPINFTNGINIGSSGSIFYNSTGINFNSNLVPSTNTLSLGTLNQPWKSLYVSTGTVFIGPTGSILINSNGLVSSTQGFASPYFQVGSINPGNGILLYEANNLLYFTDVFGNTGPISVFNIANNSPNNTYYSLGGNVGFGVTGPQQKIDVLGNIQASDTISSLNFTGTNGSITNIISNTVTTNKVQFDGVGSMYFQTGGSTGCFISAVNFNTIDNNHYLYYNNSTKEITQSQPNYFYSYSTGTQELSTGSSSSVSYFQPITFNVDPIMYNTFQHSTGGSIFTGTFESDVTLQFTYSLQIHSTSNSKQWAAAVLYLDGSPIAGSFRSGTVIDTDGEYTLTNSFLVVIPSGSHWIQLQAAVSNTNVKIGGTPQIFAPGNSYTSANLCCARII